MVQYNHCCDFFCVISSDACAFLASQLEAVTPAEQEEWIERITDCLQQKSLDSPVIEQNTLVEVIQVKYNNKAKEKRGSL